MAKTQSWEVSDDLWEHVQPLVPKAPLRRARKRYQRRPGGGRKPMEDRRSLPALFMCCAPAASGRPCPSRSAAPAPSTNTFNAGAGRGFSWPCGGLGWPNTMKWKGLLGSGKVLMELKAKRHWRRKRWVTTPPIGGKKGSKRSLLVDGVASRCPLSSAGQLGMMSNCWRSLWIAFWSWSQS